MANIELYFIASFLRNTNILVARMKVEVVSNVNLHSKS
jgi:hypothetical protein